MPDVSPIHVVALVSPGEGAAVLAGAELLKTALAQAAGGQVAVACGLRDALDAPPVVDGPCILITSMASEVERADQPWPEAEARLRARYEALSQDPRRVVFVCTVFRHVSRDGEPTEAMRRRARIRRLNLLALELSRELGVMVADIDRDLADVGGLAFETDYRLSGPYAAAAAGKSIAMAVAHVGLDEFASFAIQEAALDLLRAYQPPQAADQGPAPLKIGGFVHTVRANQRVQTVEYAEEPADDAIAASHVKRLLSGKIGFKDATALLSEALAKRGVKGSAALLFSGLKRAAGDARSSQG